MKKHLLLLSASFLLTLNTHARIGDSRSDFEYRIEENRRGMEYPSDMQEGKIRREVYAEYADFFDENDIEAVVYYKTSGDMSVDSNDFKRSEPAGGWEIHVIYYKDSSVYESYKRRARPLSLYEKNGLLSIHGEGKGWKPVGNPPKDAVEYYHGIVFDADFIRGDDKVLLEVGRDSLTFYRPEFEEMLSKQDKELSADSLKGF